MNRISGFIVLFIPIAILWEGRHVRTGSFRAPGPGLFPLILAVFLIILSILLMIPKGKNEGLEGSLLSWSTIFKRPLPVYGALLLYCFMLRYMGFVIVGVLLMTFLFKVAALRWYGAVLGAFISIGSAYLFFQVLLKGNLPKGVLGF